MRRLQRNRESARQSRKRKKEQLEVLEVGVAELHEQVGALHEAHVALCEHTLASQRLRLLLHLEPIANKPVRTAEEDAVAGDAAAQLVERFGPDCAERRAVREHHFEQLQGLLLPAHARLLLWLTHQPDAFFAASLPGFAPVGGSDTGSFSSFRRSGSSGDVAAAVPLGAEEEEASTAAASEDTSGGHVWALLCSELSLSPEQADKLRLHLRRLLAHPATPHETWRLGVAYAYVCKLRKTAAVRAAAAQAQLEYLHRLLSPPQLLRYLLWVHRNEGRLHTAMQPESLRATNRPKNGGRTSAVARGEPALELKL